MRSCGIAVSMSILMGFVIVGCSGCRSPLDTYEVYPEYASGSSIISPKLIVGEEAHSKSIWLLGVRSKSFAIKEWSKEGRQALWSRIKDKKLKVEVYSYTKWDGSEGRRCLVYLPSGELLNELVLADGYCNVEERDLKDYPDLLERFEKIEAEAKAAKRGGWAYTFEEEKRIIKERMQKEKEEQEKAGK